MCGLVDEAKCFGNCHIVENLICFPLSLFLVVPIFHCICKRFQKGEQHHETGIGGQSSVETYRLVAIQDVIINISLFSSGLFSSLALAASMQSISSQVRSVWIHLSTRDLGSRVCSVFFSHSSDKMKSMSLEHALSCSCDDRPTDSWFSLFLPVLPTIVLGAVLVWFCKQLKAPRLLSSGSVRFRGVLGCK